MEVVPGVHKVEVVKGSNVYLIEDEEMALIDSGPAGSSQRVLNYIESIGRRPEDLRYILITHSHPDHTGGALAISKSTGAQVLAHTKDTKRHKDGLTSLNYMGIFGSLKVPLPFLNRITVAQQLEDGFTLPLLGGLRVVHTPGHTPGSACYLLVKRSVLFTGDTLLGDGIRFTRSIPYPGSNMHLLHQSLERLVHLEFEVACVGHGTPVTIGAGEQLKKLLEFYPKDPIWWQLLSNIPGLLRSNIYRG